MIDDIMIGFNYQKSLSSYIMLYPNYKMTFEKSKLFILVLWDLLGFFKYLFSDACYPLVFKRTHPWF